MFSEKDKYRKFRAYLKKLMDKCQLTAYGLGQISTLDPTFIRRIASGQRNPSRRTVLQIAVALRDYSTVITDGDIDRPTTHQVAIAGDRDRDHEMLVGVFTALAGIAV